MTTFAGCEATRRVGRSSKPSDRHGSRRCSTGSTKRKLSPSGDVWLVDLDPTRGRERAGRWPAVAVSVDQLGAGPSELVIVVPLTRTDHGQRRHVPIDPPNGGVRQRFYAMPEMVRSISRVRLVERWGVLDDATLVEIARRVRLLLRDP